VIIERRKRTVISVYKTYLMSCKLFLFPDRVRRKIKSLSQSWGGLPVWPLSFPGGFGTRPDRKAMFFVVAGSKPAFENLKPLFSKADK
jgi:hypothetical protein